MLDFYSQHNLCLISIYATNRYRLSLVAQGILNTRIQNETSIQSHIVDSETLIEHTNEKAELNCSVLKRPLEFHWSEAGFFLALLLSLLLPKLCLKLIWATLKKKISHTSPYPGNAASEPLSVDLAGGCDMLLSVPLTSVLSVKNSIPHCWKQQFAKHASLESCLMGHYREQKGKFKQICLSNFLKGSQTILALW
jgi:hypothetical protein